MAAALGCLRAFFIVLSICYVIVGLAGTIATGVFIYIFRTTSDIKDLFHLSGQDSTFDNVVVALIIITCAFAVMLLAGFVGCCAMCRRDNNQCCQNVLAFFALCITLMFATAVILLAIYRTKLENATATSFEASMLTYDNVQGPVIGDIGTSAVNAYVDSTQQNRQCCGSSGYESWKTLNTKWSQAHPLELAPTSCCFQSSETGCNMDVAKIYQRGCSKVISNISNSVYTIIYIVGAVVAVVSLIEMLTACYMARTGNPDKRGCACC